MKDKHFWPEDVIDDTMCCILHSIQTHVMSSYIAIGNANFNHLVKMVPSTLLPLLSLVNKSLPSAISQQSLC